MKFSAALPLLVALAASQLSAAQDANANPLNKVIQLMDELLAKLTADGVAEDKAFVKYYEWCDETTANQQYTIKTATSKKEELEAAITKAEADIEASTAEIEDLAGKISKADQELKDATLIREKEDKEFVAAEADLEETLSALTRAIEIISKEMAKNPAAFVQVDTSSMAGLVSALSSIVDAAGIAVSDKNTLLAFVQAQQQEDEDQAPDAPDPAAYKSHSTGILDTLENLKTKAEKELAELRIAESKTKQNYDLLKGSLEDEMAYNTKEKKEEQAFRAETDEQKAADTADLDKTKKLLADTKQALDATQEDCMKTSADHDASVANRAEEMKAVTTAKKVLMETSSGAVEETYSFVQLSSRSKADLQGAEVARFIRKLARDQHSEALAQLASKITALMQYGRRSGEDPFVKVKGLIRDLIVKLEAEQAAAAKEKAYCDEQMAKTEAKKSELEDDIAKLTSTIDTKSALSAKRKAEVKELQGELASLAKEQAEMDTVRAEQHAAYEKAKADLELGLEGVAKALKVLRGYYGAGAGADALLQQPSKPVFHSKAEGAGGSIIDILEVVESDFAKALATEEAEESDAQATYDERTQEIKVSNAEKSKSVQYKVQEFKDLDKQVNELTADRASTQSELDAVNDYYAKVKERCIAKPETYEERKARREAEIKGLKEALQILNDETAPDVVPMLLQARHRHSALQQKVLSP